MSQAITTSPSTNSPRRSNTSNPFALIAGLLVIAVLFIGGGLLASKKTAAPPPPMNTGFDGYPNGVWPSRVQPFADRLVEARAGNRGSVRLFFMNAKDKQVTPIDAPTLEGEAISTNGDSVPVTLHAKPLKGVNGPGSWIYAGEFPIQRVKTDKWGLYGLRVTIPYNNVNHSVRWKPSQTSVWIDTSHLPKNEVAMPAAPTSAEEQKLFLTPGGKYTAADIAANKKQIASVVYRGIMAAHVMKPGKGQIICPVTNTLANPRFTWIIDGKTYRFCCPPCIAEFVKKAKEKPESIHPPEYYVAR